jgi:hypothetical protein
MNNIFKRIFLFLLGCMGTRLALTYFAMRDPNIILPYFGIPALVIAFGFSIIYNMGWRKTGVEVLGDKIWWNYLRPVHAFLWFKIGILALMKDPNTWMYLLLDTIIGLVAFVIQHRNNLLKL